MLKITLLTGGNDPTYALPLTCALISRNVEVDFIGNNEMRDSSLIRNSKVTYFNLRGDQNHSAPLKEKVVRIFKYYLSLVSYVWKSDTCLLHILWLNKFEYTDRTVLNIYYKLTGKKLVFTAHNVNAAERDGNDTLMNRLTLRFMYKIIDHIFVHTSKMKKQLIEEFGVSEFKITVIPFGINNALPASDLTSAQAKEKLHLAPNNKILLFFGRIGPYKGLEYAISALGHLVKRRNDYTLLIAGSIKGENRPYWEKIDNMIDQNNLGKYVIKRVEFIPDEDIEIYFKAADVLVLPYRHIFQSGVPFLSYNFGLPVIATDVGSLCEDIVEGQTGFICRPEDPRDLADKIELYFESDLYKYLQENREKIIRYANEKYSWEKVAEKTCAVYQDLLKNNGRYS